MVRWNPFKRPGPSLSAGASLSAAAEAHFHAGRFEQARVGFAAAIAEKQPQLEQRADDVALSAAIAGDLNNLGLCLGKLARFREAADVLTGSVTIFQALGPAYAPYAAGTLQSLAGALGDGGELDRAVTVSREAVETRRGQPADDRPPPARELELARTLRMFAHVRAEAGAELDEAQTALSEAQTLQLNALNRQPEMATINEIYTTELVQARLWARRGRTEDARRIEGMVRARHLDALLGMMK
ncbi:hypothetical protein [Actinoplanes sp. NBRC 103695]|uniref:hypothetical protein n=1 Tax=Actinoplanes sp. NBRC 103695 TaxID=3032202 RepID=UPI002557783E|nr:hypothetical protein [Actinoplanes sp. NBRC 103695]